MESNQKYDPIRRPSGEAERIAHRRREYLAIALRKAKPGSGSHHNFLRKRTLTYIVTDPGKILHRTPFVIVGGVATRLYMPERLTLDLNILIAAEDMLTAEKELTLAGCQKQGSLSVGRITWLLPDRTVLDVKGKNDHAYVQSEFNRRVIKRRKTYPAKLKSYLLKMQQVRNTADYSDENVGKKVARTQLSRASEMVRTIEKEIDK